MRKEKLMKSDAKSARFKFGRMMRMNAENVPTPRRCAASIKSRRLIPAIPLASARYMKGTVIVK